MTSRQLTEEQYRKVQADLLQNAHAKPLSPIYEVDLTVNGEVYTLFILPDRHNKIHALYALRSVPEWNLSSVTHELVTTHAILSALMELMIYQGVKQR